MIIRNKRNTFTLLFAWRGTILPRVLPTALVLSAISAVLSVVAHYDLIDVPTPPLLGFTLFGVILSMFLVFRNNACYDRWWEGRKQWGRLIATQRNLICDSLILQPETRKVLLQQTRQFAYMMHDRLRGSQDFPQPEYYSQHVNPPQLLLQEMQQQLIDAFNRQEIGDIVYRELTQHIHTLSSMQTACDRLINTPLPFSYSVLLHRAIYSFCFMLPFGFEAILGLWTPLMVGWLVYLFLGMDALSTQLENPFGTDDNDLPLDSIVRLIEREIACALNEPILPSLVAKDDCLLM